MPEAVCAFTGHRAKKLPWGYNERDERCLHLKKTLHDVVESLAESGVKHFVCGMALGCDLYFAEAVLAVQDEHPEITLEAAIPYRAQAEHWLRSSRERYYDILSRCAVVTVLHEEYSRECLLERNRYMVDKCDILLVCYDEQQGGTLYTLNYARKKQKELILLPIEE